MLAGDGSKRGTSSVLTLLHRSTLQDDIFTNKKGCTNKRVERRPLVYTNISYHPRFSLERQRTVVLFQAPREQF
ncbi:unnamed protein product [Parascedosporium putredinis]|uniref:Uncharacterized protein n=1 Tax=Parascedosporium putredinis TaxID=1442378 RepID=A0A9P1MFS3_9PEZI|nr:unnamed protein product [Parascedosporium putredinis]CAI8004077.1 unnamed protein product [Parascedosporium putredinis]